KQKYNKDILKRFEFAKEVVIAMRNLRKEKNIPNKESISLSIKKNMGEQPDLTFDPVVEKLCNLSEIEYVEEKLEGAISIIVKSTEFYVPVSRSIDKEAEIAKLQEELRYTRGFLNAVMKKLSNERFVQNAPEKVIAMEQKKQVDAEARIKVLEEQIKSLTSDE
ncbi:MAG: valine--tRNA ligase, partial [Bacteroidota bacterium]|nr:valine--tRNA ligase [Bacteroidota bacterium]